jgi:hypothetical protein
MRPLCPVLVLVTLVPCSVLQGAMGAGQTVGVLSGTITGTVTDGTGAVLPGVTVAISGAALMGTREAATDAVGLFRFPALEPGDYTLVLTRAGFNTVRRDAIPVGVGATVTVDVALEVAGLRDSVRVDRWSSGLDRHSTAVAARFDARQLQSLPGARSMWTIQAATPGVYIQRFDLGASATGLGGPVSAYGTAGHNRPMVEGINVSGINPTGFTLDYGAFEEVSVGTAAHGPEWPWPGVQMQFVARSGGNRYRGTIYADYLNRGWQAFNVDDEQVRGGAQGGAGLPPRHANRLWNYRDAGADAGGYAKPDVLWWYASVRSQEVAAWQVNFPVEPVLTSLRNYSAKATYRIGRQHKLVAFGHGGRNHQPNRLEPFGPAGSSLGPATAIHESKDTTVDQRARGWVWKGEWNAVMGDRFFFEVRSGQFGADRPQKPRSAAPRFEDVGTLDVAGGNRDWEQTLRRSQAFGALSYFADSGAGSHHIKIGGEAFRNYATETWNAAYPGDVLHVRQRGSPLEVYLFETPSRSESGLWAYAAYVSDSWRASSRLTLNLGLRFDRYRVFLPEQTHPAGRFNPAAEAFPADDNLIDWNVFAPRIGAIHDLTGNGKTLVKVTSGWYWLPPGDLGLNSNPNSSPWWKRYRWSDADGSGVWEPGEQRDQLQRRGGVAIEAVDPELELPSVTEAGVWLERDVGANIGIRSGVVWRGERQPFMRTIANWPFDAFTKPISIPDPGPDGQSGTVDDGAAIAGRELRPEIRALQPVNVVRNVANAESRYWTWDITATRRLAGRWSLEAGFAHTWHGDQASGYLGQPVRQNAYPLTPNDLINAGPDGRHEFRMWSLKAHGTYAAPWGLAIAPLLRHQSGQPFGRTFVASTNYGNIRVLAEPIGTRRLDHITVLDVRVEKRLHGAGHRRLSAFVDIFNLFNANPEQNASWLSGNSFLRPLSIVPPRVARIGARAVW